MSMHTPKVPLRACEQDPNEILEEYLDCEEDQKYNYDGFCYVLQCDGAGCK